MWNYPGRHRTGVISALFTVHRILCTLCALRSATVTSGIVTLPLVWGGRVCRTVCMHLYLQSFLTKYSYKYAYIWVLQSVLQNSMHDMHFICIYKVVLQNILTNILTFHYYKVFLQSILTYEGNPEGSGLILPYIPTWVLIRTLFHS